MARTARRGARGFKVACACAVLLLAALPAVAGQLELVSRVAPRRASDSASGHSFRPALSADGRYAVFTSYAANVVPGQIDGNRGNDVFLYDRVTGTVTLVSRTAGSAVTTGNDVSPSAMISANGRWVVFTSGATDLVAGLRFDGASTSNVFLWDRVTGATTLVSRSSRSPKVPGNAGSGYQALSADGRWVVFNSFATDLVDRQADANGQFLDLFLFDRVTGRTTLVSRAAGFRHRTADAASDYASISADGRYVAFTSRAKNLVSGTVSAESEWNVFVHDRVTNRNTLMSPKGATSGLARISANGEYVAFRRPLDRGFYPSQRAQLYLAHHATGRTTLVSHAAGAPGRFSSGTVEDFALSADGGRVAFTSTGTDLVAGQVESVASSPDVFLFERTTREIRLVSRSFGSPTVEGEGRSFLGGLSADGGWVVFASDAQDLGAPAGPEAPVEQSNVFLYARGSGETERLTGDSPTGHSGEPAISADGKWVAFASSENGLVPGKKDFNQSQDIFLYSRTTGQRELASRRGMPSATPQAASFHTSFSADGRYAVFMSNAPNLVPRVQDANNAFDVFLYDHALKTNTLVSRSAASPLRTGNEGSGPALISADGRFVVFFSHAGDLAPGQIDNPPSPGVESLDVFLYDRTTGQTTLVSHAAGSHLTATNSTQQGNLDITPDGSFLVFGSDAEGLVAGQGSTREINVFLYERATGAVTLISQGAGSPTEPADAYVAGRLSADGRFVLLDTAAGNLPGAAPVPDPNGQPQRSVYLFDRTSGSLARIAPGWSPSFSADARFIVFNSYAESLVPGLNASGFTPNVFLYDRIAGAFQLVSHVPGAPTTAAYATGEPLSLSTDGRFVVYSDLAGVHLFDRLTGEVGRVARGFFPVISPNGRWIAFLSEPVPVNVFLLDRAAGTTALVSRSHQSPSAGGDEDSFSLPAVTDAGLVLFSSQASNLVPADFNFESSPLFDVFLYVP